MPGGETKVWRRLARMVVVEGLVVWRMRPMPSLLAEPSQPRAIQESLAMGVGVGVCLFVFSCCLIVKGGFESQFTGLFDGCWSGTFAC